MRVKGGRVTYGSPLNTLISDLVVGKFIYLEPVTRTVILVGCSSIRCLGHPDRQGARVRDGCIDCKADVVTRSHAISRGLGHGGGHCRSVISNRVHSEVRSYMGRGRMR